MNLLLQYRIGEYLCRFGIHRYDCIDRKQHGFYGSVTEVYSCRYCGKKKTVEGVRSICTQN